MLVSKRIQQCRVPPCWWGGGGREGQPMLWHVNFLFPPNQSAEVRMFYLSRHVSALVWNKDTLPACTITKAGLCETSLLKQWFSSIARHHFGKLLWEVGLHFNDIWDTFKANAFEKQSTGRFQDREVVKSNDPLRLNYQPHGAFLEIPFCLGLGPPFFRLLFQLIIVFYHCLQR